MSSQEKKSSLRSDALFIRTRQAQRGLLIYFLLLLPFSALFEGLIIATQSIFSVVFLMWMPALASIATRLLLHEGLEDISFRLKGRRIVQSLSLAILVPLGVCVIAYGIAWLTRLTPLLPFHASDSLIAFLSLAGIRSFPVRAGLTLLYLTLIELLTATGEEIGWRGYMLPRFIDAGVPRPVLVSGLIWSVWHWPLILLSPPVAGMPQIVTASIFLITITSLGSISARLRLETGSIWPSIVLHAAWNACLVEIFNSLTRGTDTSLWTGEAGIFVALTTLIVAWTVSRGVRNWRSYGLFDAYYLKFHRDPLSML